MVDLEKFHDTIWIDHLVKTALALEAPACVLLVDLMACLVPQAIQHPGAVSEQPRGQQGSRNFSKKKTMGSHMAT